MTNSTQSEAAVPPYLSVEVTLVESQGLGIHDLGRLTMVCRYRAVDIDIDIPRFGGGRVDLVAWESRADAWRQFARRVPRDEIQAVAARLTTLGLPGREPIAHPTFSTGDHWTSLFVEVRTHEKNQTFRITDCCVGFEGADAAGLRALFRHLFRLAGYHRDGCRPGDFGMFYGQDSDD